MPDATGGLEARIRDARRDDYDAFARLFVELAVDDPTPVRALFERDLAPRMLVAEAPSGVVGYTYFQVLQGLAYVRHIAVAPEARRAGVGHALMQAVAARGRAAGATSWCLNVKPDNAAAIALYERCGLAKAYRTHALRIAWSAVGDVAEADGLGAAAIEPDDDAEVEAATDIVPGLLADARARGGRALVALRSGDGRIVAAAIFDPAFPGAYPFKANEPAFALPLLRALRPHARAEHAFVNVVVEARPDVAAALLAAGATVRLETVHMRGDLSAASTTATGTPSAASR
jgi:GNAT superfamily N-acetyltransferase